MFSSSIDFHSLKWRDAAEEDFNTRLNIRNVSPNINQRRFFNLKMHKSRRACVDVGTLSCSAVAGRINPRTLK